MALFEAFSWINIRFLFSGLVVTLQVAAVAGILSIAIGSLFGTIRFMKVPVLAPIIGVIVELLRNLPLLVLIFFAYFALPQIGIRLSVWWASVVAVTAFESAMLTEVIRSGLQAIPEGQMEAARSSGLSSLQALWHVVLPQGMRLMVPAIVSQCIALIKDTSLAVIITLPEFTRKARIIYGLNTDYVIPMFICMALVYFAICYSFSVLSKRLEVKEFIE